MEGQFFEEFMGNSIFILFYFILCRNMAQV